MAAQNRQTTSIEFIVKPKEDLYLEGSLRTLPRVSRGEPYPCQMQKNQTFSCLFRHYAKHNGLKKEDLVFFFVDELLPDQMPETVHLMPQDEIWVEHRLQAAEETKAEPKVAANQFSCQFKLLLEKGTHSDVTFLVGEDQIAVPAHKAILSARSFYFEAMFRPGGMIESSKGEISMARHDKDTFRRMMEFVYTGTVPDLSKCDTSAIISLLETSNEYLLSDLGDMCELAASKMVSLENIGKFMLLCARYNSLVLREACKVFVAEHGTELRQDTSFRQEIEQFPELGLLILDAMQEAEIDNTCDRTKRRRRTTDSTGENGSALVPRQSGRANTIGGGILE